METWTFRKVWVPKISQNYIGIVRKIVQKKWSSVFFKKLHYVEQGMWTSSLRYSRRNFLKQVELIPN